MRSRTKLFTSVCTVSALTCAMYVYAQTFAEQCQAAFSSSSASNSCGALTTCDLDEVTYPCVDTSQQDVTATSDSTKRSECRVSVHCARAYPTLQAPTQNTFTGSPSEVSSLNNCDGSLQVASC